MNDCYPVVEVVNIPGMIGSKGAGGSNGINAFTLLTAALTVPAANANVTAAVGSSVWMAIGQPVILSNGVAVANFQVVSFPGPTSVVLKFVNNIGDAASGTVFGANSNLVATGVQGAGITLPLSVANGGTGGASLLNNLLGIPIQFKTGTFVCNGATAVTVVDAAVTANSLVLISLTTVGGTVGSLPHLKTITVATGFTVVGSASDTSTYSYMIIG